MERRCVVNAWLCFVIAIVLSAAAFLPVWLCDPTHEACQPKDDREDIH
jgi:hypothetical protein